MQSADVCLVLLSSGISSFVNGPCHNVCDSSNQSMHTWAWNTYSIAANVLFRNTEINEYNYSFIAPLPFGLSSGLLFG